MAKKPTPKTQREISVSQHTSTDVQMGNPNNAAQINNRATQVSWKGDDVKPFSVGIQDIDEAIFYYFDNVIKPFVIQNGERIPVPVIYGSPEKWKSFQKDGYYRDEKGKIMAPLIMFKRDSLDKNRSIANKLDANSPNNYQIFTKPYDNRNAYSQFAVLNNRKPEKQYYAVVAPDYVTLTYSCAVFAYYVEQQNKIVEAIQYASDAYWGNPQRFQFRAMIDSFAFQTELATDNERIVRSTFTLKINGYIIPNTIQKNTTAINKFSNKTQVTISEIVDNDISRRPASYLSIAPASYPSTVTDIDGNVYNTVKIGNQLWMQSNLKVSKYRNGDSIPNIQGKNEWDGLTTGAWCYYENNPNSGSIYGKLYNFYAGIDPRGLAPEGWHVPTENDILTLFNFVGGFTNENETGSAKLKSTAIQPIPGGWKNDPDLKPLNNETGFTAIGGGWRIDISLGFDNINEKARFWTSTPIPPTPEFPYPRGVNYNFSHNSVYLFSEGDDKWFGESVRCIWDQSIDT